MIKRIVAFAVLSCSLACSICAQHFLKTSGKAIVNENQDTILLRGMGLGGWMLQEGYMLQTAEFASAQHEIKSKISDLIGNTRTEIFYDAWLQNHVTKADIDSLNSWGFNSVRLPMHYNLFTLPIEEEPISGEYTWLTKGFELTDSLISWCKQNEMYVILDLHAAPGGQGRDAAISDYDTSKPSLWESKENRDKTVALWKRIATRYVDEEWVAGYDLLNEVNWDMNGNQPLSQLYREITDSIRVVDQEHIIFIEGNWFANDFTGLTPPWDDNIVYSPHKYWSFNDQASIQWVLDLQNNHNVPLYFGESGENSNVWFRDAIRLFESHDIGWAWWPMKKIESISGPLSIVKTEEYEDLLNYWKGNGTAPNADWAFDALMQITENLKIENCVYQTDVVDAMLRQVYSDDTKPYKNHSIPGTIYASDFDLGSNGFAYMDNNIANYHVSTNEFTAWNNGWAYRNDGVDIEPCMDNISTNGYNVGWIEKDEWMQYTVDVLSDAVYNVELRIATEDNDARIHLKTGEAQLTASYQIPNTGGWQDWQTITIPDVILGSDDKNFRVFTESGDFNLSSFRFIEVSPSSTKSTKYQGAETTVPNQVKLFLNKAITGPIAFMDNISITVNGIEADVINYSLDNSNSRIVNIEIASSLLYSDIIRISYDGSAITATDGTPLNVFTNEVVINKLPAVFTIPGQLEMEDFFLQEGVQLESTSDTGGGQNIGFLDAGDYLDFHIYISSEETYNVIYRIASQQNSGACQLSLIDQNGVENIVDNVNLLATGGWQTWESVEQMVDLPEGYFTLRVTILNGPFNMNWIKFESQIEEPPIEPKELGVFIYPTLTDTELQLEANFIVVHKVDIRIHNQLGQIVSSQEYGLSASTSETIDVSYLSPGHYFLTVTLENGSKYLRRFVKL